MTYPVPLTYITAGGTLASGTEIWQFGLHCLQFAPDALAQTRIETALTTWMGDSDSYISTEARMEWIKIAQIGVDGHYPPDSEPVIIDLFPFKSGISGGQFVPQKTVVISTTTAKVRGLAKGGRFYPPPSGLGANSLGHIDIALVSAVATRAKVLLDDLNIAIAPSYLVVASSKGAGHVERITGLRVGNVIDTQRRRRNRLQEEYTARILGT